MRKFQKAFTLIEVLLTAMIVSVALLISLTLYSTLRKDAAESQHRLVATISAESALAEIEDHVYGTPPPPEWGNAKTPFQDVFPLVLHGNRSQLTVERTVTSKNGSFFGRSTKSEDELTIHLRWWEPNVDGEEDYKDLKVTVMVSRQPDLVEVVQ